MAFDIFAVLRSDDVASLESYLCFTCKPDELCDRPSSDPSLLLKDRPPLISVACLYGSLSCVHFLILYGADLCLRDGRQRPPFLFAVAGGSIPVAQLLLANEDESLCFGMDRDGDCALHYAVTFRQLPMLNWLIQTTALPTSFENKRKVTPLHIASTQRLTEFIRVLCDWDANPNARTDRVFLICMGQLRFIGHRLNLLLKILKFWWIMEQC
jgi:ankyrin repeat protein